jgi:hypothetical protein
MDTASESISMPNKALHQMATPLRSIATGELGRYSPAHEETNTDIKQVIDFFE